MTSNVKILIAGDLEGNLDSFAEKLDILNKKGTTFDCIFIVGNVLTPDMSSLKEFISGSKKIAFPVYFIDCGPISQLLMNLYPDGKEIFPNFNFLGRAGVRSLHGINVAFLSGLENKHYPDVFYNERRTVSFVEEQRSANFFTSNDITKLLLEHEQFSSAGIDIFLSNEWPENFDVNLPLSISGFAPHRSGQVRDVVKKIEPRYHFVALDNVHYQRPPYLNLKGKHISRLISVAKVPAKGSSSKEKFFYALQLTPFKQMDPKDITAQTADTTACPYSEQKVPEFNHSHTSSEEPRHVKMENEKILATEAPSEAIIEELTENQVLFIAGFDRFAKDDEISQFISRWGQLEVLDIVYDESSKRHKGYCFAKFKELSSANKALLDAHKYTLNGRRIFVGKARKNYKETVVEQNCWFCLSNPQLEKDLIVKIFDEVYIALDKGPIVPGHLLIVPIGHYPSSVALPREAEKDVEKAKTIITEIYGKYHPIGSHNILLFERFAPLTSNIAHLQLQVVPFRGEFKSVTNSFDRYIRNTKAPFFKLNAGETVRQGLKPTEFFYYFEFRDSNGNLERYVYPLEEEEMKKHGRDFARKIVCELFGLESRLDWRSCVFNEEEKANNIKDYKKLLSIL